MSQSWRELLQIRLNADGGSVGGGIGGATIPSGGDIGANADNATDGATATVDNQGDNGSGRQNPDPIGDAQGWRDSIPEQYREWDEVKNSDSPEKFYEQIANLRSAIGQSLRIPTEDASDAVKKEFRDKLRSKVGNLVELPAEGDTEGWDNFYGSLGRPQDASGYTAPENLQQAGITPERFGELSAMAHKHGLSKGQFENLMSDIIAKDTQTIASTQQARQDEIGKLKGEWGMAFEERTKMAQSMVSKFFPHLDASSMNANDMRAFHAIATSFGKEASEFMQQSPSAGNVSPNEAKLQISEIRANGQHPYNNPSDPGYRAARDKVARLYAMAYPGDSSSESDSKTFGIG